MKTFLSQISKYIDNKALFSPNATVVVGVSGGADSIAMLDVLVLLGYRCIAAHCNFHLRGEESDEDARFVKKWCKQNDIEFTSIDFDTQQFASDKKISIEMAARELRYDWFEIVRRQFEAESIAVAHHKDDSVETVLLNLIRGTGISGLSGISATNGKIVRPMLCVNRSEIETYINDRQLPFRIDSTNNEDNYTRNFIRLNVLPLLRRLNPSVSESIFRTSENVAEAEKVYREAINTQIAAVFWNNKINIERLRQSVSPMQVLFEILTPLGFHPSVIEDVEKGIGSISGKIYLSGSGYRLIRDRDCFLIDKTAQNQSENEVYFIDENITELREPIHLLFINDVQNDEIRKEKHSLTVDAQKLKFPLKLRKWQSGDWFIPFGMNGKKKLSDFFTDQKFNLKQKENTWILLSGDDVVWIVGHRADNRSRVSDKTEKRLMCVLMDN